MNDDSQTRPIPSWEPAVSTDDPQPAAAVETDPATPAPAEQTVRYRSGPAPVTTVVGAFVLVVAVLAGLRLTVDPDLNWDWGAVVPISAAAFGLLLVLVGVLSLSRRARRAEDAPNP